MLIKINSLYSLDEISPDYYFDTSSLSVVNLATNKEKKVSINKRGYPIVYLSTTNANGRKTKNVPMHKIVALAMISNEPYILIEHLDDNKLNYHPENLRFSNKIENAKSMARNGICNHYEKQFEVEMLNGERYTGTMKELSKTTGIPRASLYDRYYRKRSNHTPRSKNKIKKISLVKTFANRSND